MDCFEIRPTHSQELIFQDRSVDIVGLDSGVSLVGSAPQVRPRLQGRGSYRGMFVGERASGASSNQKLWKVPFSGTSAPDALARLLVRLLVRWIRFP